MKNIQIQMSVTGKLRLREEEGGGGGDNEMVERGFGEIKVATPYPVPESSFYTPLPVALLGIWQPKLAF